MHPLLHHLLFPLQHSNKSQEHSSYIHTLNVAMLLQAELEAELQKKKARAARFNVPVKTNADEV